MTNTGQQGWINPATNSLTPIIISLSVTNSISGAETIVAILGSGFKPFSTITFGPYNPIQIFISSGQINFYVPFSTLPGTYPVQVTNVSTSSNTVNFFIDPPIGFWEKNANGQISNTNYIDSVKINGSLYVQGQFILNGTVMQTSDYRIKSVIEPLNNNSLYSVDNLKPIKYLNKQSGATEIGFIAHELQKEFPYLVTGEKDGKEIQTVNYIGLIGILVKEIQELKTEIKELKNLK